MDSDGSDNQGAKSDAYRGHNREDDLDDSLAIEPEYLIPDRKRGILTQKDREYLMGDLDIDGQEERNLKYRMEDRIVQGLYDIRLMSRYLDDEIIGRVIDKMDSIGRNPFLSFIYRIRSQIDMRSASGRQIPTHEQIEIGLSETIQNQEENSRQESKSIDVKVDIRVSESDINLAYLKEKVRGDGITHKELMRFIRTADSESLIRFIDFVRDRGSIPTMHQNLAETYDLSAQDVMSAIQNTDEAEITSKEGSES